MKRVCYIVKRICKNMRESAANRLTLPPIANSIPAVLSSARRARLPVMLKPVLLQCVATAIAVLLAGVVAGGAAALSAGLAGLACVLPNGLFAWTLRQMAHPSVAVFVMGELLKLMVVTALLVLFWRLMPSPHAGGALTGLLFALQANFLGLLTRT